MTNFPSDVLPVYTSDIFSIGKLVPSLHGPWSLDCCAKGLGLLSLEIVCNLQMMAVHCFMACVAIICIVAVTCHLLPVAIICVLQFVLLGALPRAILHAPWCFLVGCLVPFFVLQFVLFRVLLRAVLCARVRAFWCIPPRAILCVCVLQFVLFGVLLRAILHAPVRAFWIGDTIVSTKAGIMWPLQRVL